MKYRGLLNSAICVLSSILAGVALAQPASAPGTAPSTAPATTQAKKPPPREDAPQPWNQMQYGSLLSATFENRKDSGDFTHKGIAITIGEKDQRAYVIFDTELLRYSAGWTGEKYLHFYGVAFDGKHGPNPCPWGKLYWAVKGQRAGISLSDDLTDPRPQPYGPLPRETWGRFKGLYRNGERVILNYTVGDCDVLDMPESRIVDGHVFFGRALEVGPSENPITIVLAENPVPPSTWPANSSNHVPQLAHSPRGSSEGIEYFNRDGVYAVKIAPHKDVKRIRSYVFRWPEAAEIETQITDAPFNLRELCSGGPSNWPQTVETKGLLGTGNGPYVVDTVEVPMQNPYKSWMRFGGFDLFSDNKRAAISTWNGDVWIVSGIDERLEKLTWKRFAAGLFQPLGLKIVKDEVYVLGRDQITRLKDLNGDGEADQYECFNNDCMASPSFHEFAFDLQCDSKGNFYYAKGGAVNPGGRGWQRITPHNGTILRVSPDGSNLDVFAAGVRAPNGMSCGPQDQVTVADNQGTWMPVCRLNLVSKGSFLGVPDLAHVEKPPTTWGDLVCWFPYPDVDNSSGGGVWVTSDAWGPFKDRMLHTSYGQCSLSLVMFDQVDGAVQGAIVKFPNLEFESGIDRGRIGPVDGQLYLCGLKGWQTRAAKDACFQRVRYTGKPVRMPTSFHVKENGIELGFTTPLDPKTAGDPDSYDVEQWNYIWSKDYGSPEVHVDDPEQKGRQPLKVTEARLAADKMSVLLVMPDVQPVMQFKIALNLDAADGQTMEYEIYGTINKVPNWKPKPKPATKPAADAGK